MKYFLRVLSPSADSKRALSVTRESTVKPVLRGHSKRRPKFGFQDSLLLNADQMYCRMLQESILQYFDLHLATICL